MEKYILFTHRHKHTYKTYTYKYEHYSFQTKFLGCYNYYKNNNFLINEALRSNGTEFSSPKVANIRRLIVTTFG